MSPRMSYPRSRLVVALGATLLLAAQTGLAQGSGAPAGSSTPDAGKPADKAAAPAAPRRQGALVFVEARFPLEKELDKLREAKSIKGTTTALWELHVDGNTPNANTFITEFALQKPDKLWMKTKDLTVWVDGTTLTIRSESLKQYLQRPMPSIWDLRTVLEELSGQQIRGIPSEPVIRPGLTIEQSLRNVRTMEQVKFGEHEGKQGVWITGTGEDDRQPSSVPIIVERWHAESTGLCELIKQDMTSMYQDLADRKAAEDSDFEGRTVKPAKYRHARFTTKVQRELNPALPDSTFAFTPVPGDKKVDKFIFLRPNLKEQIALIGRPMPLPMSTGPDGKPAEAKPVVDLDDKPVDLAALKGKVVVMDFWATWCGPCVAGMPAMHELMKSYTDAGKPVAFIAVNREPPVGSGPGVKDKVRRFLSAKKFDMPQIFDSDLSFSNQYFAVSIPQVVIIDQQGIVADVDVGYVAGKEKELKAKIDLLLDGKPIHTPEALSKLRQQVGLEGPGATPMGG
ncbi:MAG: TlpA family protein disulfide reductase [Phycisphaerales bacterium]|nr:TlpA family protein disulfide reductase [Phycisphaerales bacterium]